MKQQFQANYWCRLRNSTSDPVITNQVIAFRLALRAATERFGAKLDALNASPSLTGLSII